MFVKFGTEAMKAVKGASGNPGVITKAAKTGMSKSGDPNTLERNKKVGHRPDPGAKAPIVPGKRRAMTPMAPKKSKVTKQLKGSVAHGPAVHDKEGMY